MKKIYLLLLTFVFKAEAIFAQTGIKNSASVLNKVAKDAGVEDKADVATIAGSILNAVLGLTGIIFLGLMVYAGVLWMTARGEEAKIDSAKKIIVACVIGLMILVSAYAITFFLMNRLTEV